MVIALSTVIQEDHCGADDALKTPFAKGETVTYSIKKLKLTVGTATLTFHGLVSLNGREAVEILLTAKGFRFFDEEKIYLDPVTLYPIVIRRDLDIFGVKEKIDEFYDLERGKVRIVKTAKGVTSEQTLTGSERFDNIYGFIYRYRRSGQLVAGEEFTLHLPMRDVKFKLVEHKKIRVANRDFDAYYMDSVPKKYKVWFDSGPQMIPLMIDGAIGFGHTSMVMTAYAPGR
ncbi:MAG TPA: DUF3108 domain-containing protein [Candidatus Omnitrophota bacterium]|nr:DUF3108 domain-containing protein [Candidatus Omnitrophota bacterium]